MQGRSVCRVKRLGLMEYLKARELQSAMAVERAAGRCPDVLLLLEHPPTYTLGRRGNVAHILASPTELDRMGAAVHRSDRGGDVTFHGPGQLVGYPVISLAERGGGASGYVRDLEEMILRALAAFHVDGARLPGYRGVWVGNKKIAAIGVKVDVRGITHHGFALNVATDLDCFARIIPCGIRDKGVTSMERLLGRAVSMGDVMDAVVAAFECVFNREMVEE